MSEVWYVARMNLMKCWYCGKIWMFIALLAVIMCPQINVIQLIMMYLWLLFPQSYEEIDKTDQLTAMLPIKRARVVQGWILYGLIGITLSSIAQLPLTLVGKKFSGVVLIGTMVASICLLAFSVFSSYAIGGTKGRVVFIVVYVLGCTSAPFLSAHDTITPLPNSHMLLLCAVVACAVVLAIGYGTTMWFYNRRQF